ncbi:MAG: hypothetical protein DMF11_14195 [Verrucomicrobia bacterium]|nr:MAG: hypothetical protein DMF11_14195 [Verrucomicrobiota bacterium]
MDTKVNINERNFRSTPCELARRDRQWQRQSVHCIALVIFMFALWTTTGFASAGQQPQKSANRTDSSRGEFSGSFQVPSSDSAKAEALANQLAALSPKVDRNEAKLLADCAYATVSQLRRQYRMFGTPIFNNFLIYHGLKKRGYCYQWSEDLLVALDALRLSSLELRWGEANPGNWRENNCIVVTAKGRPFRSGIMLDCWRHLGHLYFRPVVADADPYVENRAYARFVLARSAARNSSGANHRVAFQMSNEASGNSGDN